MYPSFVLMYSSFLAEDLLSLLDSGLHPDDPAFVMDPDAIFPEEMFYSAIPRRSRAGRFFDPPFEHERDRDRERDMLRRERWWSGLGLAENSGAPNSKTNTAQEKPTMTPSKKSPKEPLAFLGDIEWWTLEVKILKILKISSVIWPFSCFVFYNYEKGL